MASEGNYMQVEWFYPQRTQHWVLYTKLILAAIFFSIFLKKNALNHTIIKHSKTTDQTEAILFKEELSDGRVFKAPGTGPCLQLCRYPEKQSKVGVGFGDHRVITSDKKAIEQLSLRCTVEHSTNPNSG